MPHTAATTAENGSDTRPSTIHVILNSRSGTAADDEARTLVLDAEREMGGVLKVVNCAAGDDLAARARTAVSEGARVLVAAGGDGTVNTIAAVLVGTDVVLGVLPLGTLNHFAKDAGIPTDVAAALSVLQHGRTVDVDVGEVNGRIFVNNSGLGLYPSIVHRREARQRQGASKWPAAVAAAIRALVRFRVLRLRVVVEGERLLRRTPAVFVGNNEYRLDLGIEPKREKLDAGMLCLYIPRAHKPLQFLLFTLRALFGAPRNDKTFDMLLTDSFTIESRHRHLRVSIDGEVEVMQTPLEYHMRPKSLRILVPSEH